MISAQPYHAARIKALPSRTSTTLRSTLLVLDIAQILSELARNALDAGACQVECWVDLSKFNQSVRVEDDGVGISEDDLANIGERYTISRRDRNNYINSGDRYGFRCEAIPSIAALGLLEITTRARNSGTFTKVINNSKTIYHGKASRELGRAHGTTVTVRNLFNIVPVRRAALSAASSASTLTSCRLAIQTLALSHPSVTWTLWEEDHSGKRRIISVHGAKTTLEAFRGLYGSDSAKTVHNVRFSAGDYQADGFISLESAATKSHQHLFINGRALEWSELYHAVAQRFAESNFPMARDMANDDTVTKIESHSTRRSECHPLYVLNIQCLIPFDIHGSYPTLVDIKESDKLQTFVVAIIDEFLRKNDFARLPKSKILCSPSPPKRRCTVVQSNTENPELSSRPQLLNWNGRKAAMLTTDDQRGNVTLHANLLHAINEQASGGVLSNFTLSGGIQSSNDLFTDRPTFSPYAHFSEVRFSKSSLSSARIIGQVDRKYVCAVLETDSKGHSLVLFDQHAIDERVALEDIVDTLCTAFTRGDIATTNIPEGHLSLELLREECDILELPGVRDMLYRWGIRLGPLVHTMKSAGHTKVPVISVPTLFRTRLAKQGGTELLSLVRSYLPLLAERIDELQDLILLWHNFPNSDTKTTTTWTQVQRWMPMELAKLTTSKACRGAIMFGDFLRTDQCSRLLVRLSTTRSPYICAHGRPTLAPLCLLGQRPNHKAGEVDWTAWRSRNSNEDV